MLTLRIISYQESLKKQTKIDHYFTRLSSSSTFQRDTDFPGATHARSLSAEGPGEGKGKGKQKADRKGKGKEILFSDRSSDIEESVVGSETADEEESSFKILQPGPRLYPHPEDSQDLNLYPSQYDHSSGFSQVYGNLLL